MKKLDRAIAYLEAHPEAHALTGEALAKLLDISSGTTYAARQRLGIHHPTGRRIGSYKQNRHEVEGDTAKLYLDNIEQWCLIDAADLPLALTRHWYGWRNRIDRTTYVRTVNSAGSGTFIHRLILAPPDHLVVDHLNSDGLDNRRQNLKVCTQKENSCNRNPELKRASDRAKAEARERREAAKAEKRRQQVYENPGYGVCRSRNGNTSNPHAVTAAQVGAYTTSAADTLLAAKAPQASPSFSGTVTVASQIKNTVQALTDAASVTWNMDSGPIATLTIGGNRTLAAPTNIKAGGTYILCVTQDGTGTRTLAYNAIFKWAGGTAPALSTVAGSKDVLTFASPEGNNLYGAVQKAFA